MLAIAEALERRIYTQKKKLFKNLKFIKIKIVFFFFPRHPLFSLVALMFEKCELATSTPRDANVRDDICTSQTLDEDFNEFAKQVNRQERDN